MGLLVVRSYERPFRTIRRTNQPHNTAETQASRVQIGRVHELFLALSPLDGITKTGEKLGAKGASQSSS